MTFDVDGPNRRSFLRRTAVTAGVAAGGLGTGVGIASGEAVTVGPDDGDDHDTIQEAVEDADDGDTIAVSPGIYGENVVVPGDRALTIIGDPGGSSRGPGPDAPVLDGGGRPGAAFFLENGDAETPPTVIDGFEIRNYGTDVNDESGAGVQADSRSNVDLRNLHVRDVEGSGVHSYHHDLPSVRNWSVRDSIFDACARTGIWLLNAEHVRVRDNLVRSTEGKVSDRDDVWWEEESEDGNPKSGVEIVAHSIDGESGRVRDAVVGSNRIVGPYDDTAIRIFSYNATNPPGDTLADLESVVVRDNTVRITDEFDDELRDEYGIIVAANASSHPGDDGPISPARIRDVTVHGNDVEGAGHGYQLFSMAPLTHGGMADVKVTDNTARNCERGIVAASFEDGELANVLVRDVELEACDAGVVLSGVGVGGLHDVEVRDVSDVDPGALTGTPDHESDLGGSFDRSGIAIRGSNGEGVHDVTVSGYAAPDRPVGILLESLIEDGVDDVTVTGCSFEGTEVGVRAVEAVADGIDRVLITESAFVETGTGLETASVEEATDGLGDWISVYRSGFLDSADWAIDNRDGRGAVHASCNFWGHATGPAHAENRVGRGDPVTDGVDYAPWLPQSYELVPVEACRLGDHRHE